ARTIAGYGVAPASSPASGRAEPVRFRSWRVSWSCAGEDACATAGGTPALLVSMADVNITVDGKKVTAPAGTLLIEACKSVGIEVPSFCYYPNLSLDRKSTRLNSS